jgi:hypothetical protein
MVVRRDSCRWPYGQRGLLTAILAGVALVATLTIAGPGSAHRAVPLGAKAPAPDSTVARGGVTFEVVPIQPTASPTGRPTPSPSATGGGHLPVTGADRLPPGWLLTVGVLLLLIGGLIVAGSAGVRRFRPV